MEIKRDNVTEGKAVSQMVDYMMKAAQHPSREEALCGYLIMGREVIPFQVNMDGARVIVAQGDSFNMFAAGDRLTAQLCEVAVRNWNV